VELNPGACGHGGEGGAMAMVERGGATAAPRSKSRCWRWTLAASAGRWRNWSEYLAASESASDVAACGDNHTGRPLGAEEFVADLETFHLAAAGSAESQDAPRSACGMSGRMALPSPRRQKDMGAVPSVPAFLSIRPSC